MAAPNIRNVSSIIGKTVVVDLASTAATAVLSNPAGSGKVLKINSLYIANDDGAANTDITVNLYSAAALGGSAVQIAKGITVPAKATLVVISKDAPIYLEENTSIGAIAAVANDLNVICSFEEIA